MPLMPISHSDWQTLRAVKRAKKKHPTGKELRLAPTRRTKDGSFLDVLVAEGLLEVVTVEEVNEKNKKWPASFRAHYQLTEKGEFAAEYGEYEREMKQSKK